MCLPGHSYPRFHASELLCCLLHFPLRYPSQNTQRSLPLTPVLPIPQSSPQSQEGSRVDRNHGPVCQPCDPEHVIYCLCTSFPHQHNTIVTTLCGRLGLTAHACNSSHGKSKSGGHEFEATLGYPELVSENKQGWGCSSVGRVLA